MKLRQLFESTNSVGLIFGRFNPPHKGHKAAWQMAAKNDAWYVGTNPEMVGPKTHTGKGSENKDPLPYNIKIQAMKLIMPEVTSHIVPHESWFSLASKLYNDHGQVNLKVYTDESWVINTLERYNGSEGRHGYYEFSKIQHIPTPRITSASDLRMAVKNNNPKEFAKLSGVDIDAEINGNLYFDIVKKYLAMGKGVASMDESIFGTKRVKPVSPTSDRKANPIFPNKKKTKPAPTRYKQQDHVSLSADAKRLMKSPNHHNTNEQATDRLGGMGSSREWKNPQPPSKYHSGNRKNKISSNPISNNIKPATDYDVEIPSTVSTKSAAIIRKVLARQAAREKLQGK